MWVSSFCLQWVKEILFEVLRPSQPIRGHVEHGQFTRGGNYNSTKTAENVHTTYRHPTKYHISKACVIIRAFYFSKKSSKLLNSANPLKILIPGSTLPNHTFIGQTWSSKRLTSIVHILSPETDNCPSWISRRERMSVENISWSNLHERMLPTQRGSNLQPPDHQSRCASNWAVEAG